MTEHDQQKVCLRCGKPAGDQRFCGACRSLLDSLCALPPIAGACDETQPAAESGEVRLERAATEGGRGGDRGTVEGAVRVEPDCAAQNASPARVELERISATADERVNKSAKSPVEVGRFEELLTPESTEADRTLAAYQQADAAGSPEAAANVGVLLEQRGDLEGALAAYRRADERGDVTGSFNLGCLLAEVGDLLGATAAFQRADERGDAGGASNLGVLLEQGGDLEGALAAYRRADERSDAIGAFNLGVLLARRGDFADARRAYRRAAERGDPEMKERAAQAEADATPADVSATGTARAEEHGSEKQDTLENPSATEATGDGGGPILPASPSGLSTAEPDRDIAESPTNVALPNPVESVARPGISNPVAVPETRQVRPSGWVVAIAVLALLGLVVVLARRWRRRSS